MIATIAKMLISWLLVMGVIMFLIIVLPMIGEMIK